MATTANAPKVAAQLVTITVEATADSSSLRVSPGLFQISKKLNQQVKWHCDQSGFTVDFGNDSPFQFSQFQRSSPGSVLSGLVKPDLVPPGKSHFYKYTVTVGGSVLDPEGQVDQ